MSELTGTMETALRLLKGHGKLSLAELHPRWPGPVHTSTLQDVLGTLWANGYVDRRRTGPHNSFVYSLARKGVRYLERAGLSALRHEPKGD